ncbi:reverse transcriptase-like protein [Aliibacillus thermotolerans]|uniref:Reverse transcriptase-like protein n=1 Tax=Aliibacillus thermotolerans TaxID=1834418 RepID=A0ABW0U5Y3_9BACI|nr:reverse transcriptase-like protein [Aliibacillus thermotolerans]MDA3130076.1 reverse transcriptase-like protein [Aliibacillus thermotolerans]
MKVFIDGASAGSPGPAGAGIYIHSKEHNIEEHHAIPLGTLTNHEAEFQALLEALYICEERKWEMVFIHTDSQLVEEAVTKEYVKNELYKPYLSQILERLSSQPLFFIKWIPSSQNRMADQLSKRAIQKNHR